MGEGFGVFLRVFRGYAVENFYSIGSASALGASRPARPSIGRATVSRFWHQSENGLQMVEALSNVGRPWAARSLSPAQTFAPADSRALGSGPRPGATSTSVLGCQENLRSPALPPPAPTPAPNPHDHRLVATVGADPAQAALGASRSAVAGPGPDEAPAAQRGVDGGFQGLVPHPRRPAGRSVDGARPVQPFYLGHPAAAPPARAGAPVFCGIIRVDHGRPFAGDGALDLSRLSAWWLRLGIQVEFTGRARPQDNAAHEQMHGVYQKEVASPPAATPRGQQWRTTRWVDLYNHRRPHEALGQRVPAGFYHQSRRRYRAVRAELQYPSTWRTRRVTDSGYVRWRGRLRVIGRAFGRQRVGFKEVSVGVHEVYFAEHLIGLLVDTDPGGLRPARRSQTPIVPPRP
jgi:hypothetical protein